MKKGTTLIEMIKMSVLASIVVAAMPELASAATASASLNEVLHSVAKTQISALPFILSTVCYVGGAFLLVSGALSLKKHAENPAGEPMGKGIARLITGGAITAVPALTGIIQRTAGINGATTASYDAFTVTF